jgi:hypothetical protein
MPTKREIRETVQSIKRHVRNDDGYLNSEERTKHVLIDPVLRALGWNTGDPSRVKIEFRKRGMKKRPDYALFRQDPKLVGLVEAKILTPEQITRLKERIRRHDSNIIAGFERMRSPNTAPQQAGREILFGPEEWAALRKANESQLEDYVQEFNMTAGKIERVTGLLNGTLDRAQTMKDMISSSRTSRGTGPAGRPERAHDITKIIRRLRVFPKRTPEGRGKRGRTCIRPPAAASGQRFASAPPGITGGQCRRAARQLEPERTGKRGG